MDQNIKRNIVKVLLFAGVGWISYKLIKGFAAGKSSTQIVKETFKPVETAVAETKKVFKKFLKGSPEAKAHMAKMRSMNKTPYGQGKMAKITAARKAKQAEKKARAAEKKAKKVQPEKVEKVMEEFKEGTLKTSAGETVTDQKQAVAIAMSEAGLSKKE